ncbi:MAG: 4Fe-4S binding protein [Desulfobacterales bacterium]
MKKRFQNNKKDLVYIRLQLHLNQQAVGFPATWSGVELRILKHIFSPEEAEIVTYLTYRSEPLGTIFSRAGHLVDSPQELETLLDRIQRKGGIESREKDGTLQYCCAPLVVGMYEFQLGRLTPDFIRDFNRYTSDVKFGIEFLSTELPQMRTIPVAKSLSPQNNVSTFDEVTARLRRAEEPFAVIECICRKKKTLEGKTCKITQRTETCLAIGDTARMVRRSGVGREISRQEAISIIGENQKQGLVLQPSNTEKADFICSCCGCCCGMLQIHKRIPKPVEFWASNFRAVVDATTCSGCGNCAESCQVGAVSICENSHIAVVDLNRCLGCGVCVSACPTESIALMKKPTEVRPPRTREDLYDIIMAKKKGRLGKLKLTGKVLVDAVRTGQTDLLKK